jgi:uncharacterized protein
MPNPSAQRPPDRLDIAVLAQSNGQLSGFDLLSNQERLVVDLSGLQPDSLFNWQVSAWLGSEAGAKPQVWMRLRVSADLPMQCQRCLETCIEPVAVEREYRFVASEALAAEGDDAAEEDLLVLSKQFNLRELVEDELLMALPLVAKHQRCPKPVNLAVQDEGFEAQAETKKKPFADLKGLLVKDLSAKRG